MWSIFISFKPILIPLPDGGFQIEHVYRIDLFPNLLKKRLFIYGFADHDIQYGGNTAGDNHVWVFEHQLDFRLVGGLHAMVQVRHEEFLAEQTGAGFGLEYVIHY